MLDKIADCISNISDIPFDEFYQNYVMDIQDASISRELLDFRISSSSPADVAKYITKFHDKLNEVTEL